MLRLPAEVPQTRVGYPAILADSTDPINSSPPHKPKSRTLPKTAPGDHYTRAGGPRLTETAVLPTPFLNTPERFARERPPFFTNSQFTPAI